LIAHFRNSLMNTIFDWQVTSVVSDNGALNSEIGNYVKERKNPGARPDRAIIV
jgi:hypothetical protein